MAELHLFLHFLPPGTAFGGPLAQNLNEPIPIAFDRVMERLNQLPGGFCEPDGAWGWNTTDQSTRTGGTMQAFGEQVMCVETWGQIHPRDWSALLDLFGLTESTTVVQLVEQGRFLSGREFIPHLDSGPTSDGPPSL
jgi:hypothetical protein